MTLQKMPVKKIFSRLRVDLQQCIKFMKMNKKENVEIYFWTLDWDEISKRLEVICRPFSDFQRYEIEKVISELHNYFIIKDYQNDTWTNQTRTPSKN